MARTINRMVGFETGGFEEANAVDNNWSVDGSGPTEILGKTLYCAKANGTSDPTNNHLDLKFFDYVADAGDGYIFSVDLEFIAWPAEDERIFRISDDVDFACDLRLTTAGVMGLSNAAAAVIDSTSTLSLNTKYTFIVYFEHSDTGAWEWWLSTSDGTPTSLGSGTSDFFNTSATTLDYVRIRNEDSTGTCEFYVNNFVFMSGCTTSDRLNEDISLVALATPYGNPTESGDTLSSGNMANTQQIPLTGSAGAFDAASSGQSRWVQSDARRLVEGYFADVSDEGPTDSGGVWTNDSNAFDGDPNTSASTSTAANSLDGGGTTFDAAFSGEVTQVYMRVLAEGSGTAAGSVDVLEDGTSTILNTRSFSGAKAWTAWGQLSAHSGGWSAAKVAALDFECWMDSGTGTVQIYAIELGVRTNEYQTPADFGATNTVAAKIIMDETV